MKDCSTCRWFDRNGAHEVDGYEFDIGECLRPEGPLEPRTVRRQVVGTSTGGVMLEAGIPVKCATHLVSTGMICRVHEPRAVTDVTAEPSGNPDLWGN